MNCFRFLFCLPLFFFSAARAQVNQIVEGQTLVSASLLADTTALTPGKPFEVGLLLEMAPGWHTYWEYPGDAGLPTTIAWTLPEGFGAGPIQWPLPRRILEPGDIEVYAYKDKVLLITTILPPADLKEQSVTLRARAPPRSNSRCRLAALPRRPIANSSPPSATNSPPRNRRRLPSRGNKRVPRLPSPSAG